MRRGRSEPAQDGMPESLRKTRGPLGNHDFHDSKSSMPNDDNDPPNDDTAPKGLTLKQAALIYFGGLSVFVVGLVIIGITS